MGDLASIFDQCVTIDAGDAAAAESVLATIPDQPAAYLLATQDDQPILLASGLAVRAILRRRLGEPVESPAAEPLDIPRLPGRSKRADLRPLVRKLYLRWTCSHFETDLAYLWLARAVYPRRYRELIPRRHCWMISADASADFPRVIVTDRFDTPGLHVGPLPDRQSAGRLVDLLTLLFGLCHYYQVLRQSPNGRACEYKEMGRCLGPCDGSISMDAYRAQVTSAIAFAADRSRQWRADRKAEMSAAADRLEFEQAARIKDAIARAGELDQERYDWLEDMAGLDVLIVQRGRQRDELRTWRALAGRIIEGPRLSRKALAKFAAEARSDSPADAPAALVQAIAPTAAPPADADLHADEAALLAAYLFRSQSTRGLLLRRPATPDAALAARILDVFPAPAPRSRRDESGDRQTADG